MTHRSLNLTVPLHDPGPAVRIDEQAPQPPPAPPPSDAAIRARMELQAMNPAFYAQNRGQLEALVETTGREFGLEALRSTQVQLDIWNRVAGRATGPRPPELNIASRDNVAARRRFEQSYPELYEQRAERVNALIGEYERAGKPLDPAELARTLAEGQRS